MSRRKIEIDTKALRAAVDYLRASLAYKDSYVEYVTTRVAMDLTLGAEKPTFSREEWLVAQTRPHLQLAIETLEQLLSEVSP